jgi:hypothetical protein
VATGALVAAALALPADVMPCGAARAAVAAALAVAQGRAGDAVATSKVQCSRPAGGVHSR